MYLELESLTTPEGTRIGRGTELLVVQPLDYGDVVFEPGLTVTVETVEFVASERTVLLGLDEAAPLSYLEWEMLTTHLRRGEVAVVSVRGSHARSRLRSHR